ncbi:MAG: molybdenum cofactor guanylyltransferase [Candidatus Thermoplasmatota archaeon]|nr:molybdenum cofactor guanylyltransferase [Candidatus Thermoplasmatota archaeon]
MLSGVVLAGGRGSRIGGDKGLADVGGQPMAALVLRALSEVTEDIVVAVTGGARPAYTRALGPSVQIVEDRAHDRGPLEGLSNALRLTRHDLVAVVPCDVPFLKADILRLLEARAAGRDAAVPVVNGFLEPLVAVYRAEPCLNHFSRELDLGAGKVGNAIRHMDFSRVEEPDLRAVDERLLSFWNVNSKEDLTRAGEMARREVTFLSSAPSTA